MIDRLQKGTVAAVDAMRRSSDAGDGTSAQANQAGASLDTMAQLIGTINSMNAQIASAAEEQTAVAKRSTAACTRLPWRWTAWQTKPNWAPRPLAAWRIWGIVSGQLVGQFRI